MEQTAPQKPGSIRSPARNKIVVWEPQRNQRGEIGAQIRLVTCPYNEILYGGAKGGGKSDGILGMWLAHMGRNPRWARGIIFRKSYPELEQLMARAREIFIPLGAIWKQQQKTWYFKGGAILKFRFLDNAEDAKKYQGHENTFIAFDEVGDVQDPAIVDALRGALRSSKPIKERILLLCGNPMGTGHKWLKRRFIAEDLGNGQERILEPEVPIIEEMKLKDGTVLKWSRVFIPALLEDNPKLLENDPGYEFRLLQMTRGKPWLYRALRFGDWTVKREVPGALLTDADIQKQRVMMAPYLVRKVLGVDPTVKGYDPAKTQEELMLELGDECGIVGIGRAEGAIDSETKLIQTGKRYVLKDASLKGDPTVWARAVVEVAIRDEYDVIVAEINNGGELVRILIMATMEKMRSEGRKFSMIHVEVVSARKGKYVRAEPVAWDVKDGNLYFVGDFKELEEEWTTWLPDGRHASPNRIDAMAWAWIFDTLGKDDTGMLDYYKQMAAKLPKEAQERMQRAKDRIEAAMERGRKK